MRLASRFLRNVTALPAEANHPQEAGRPWNVRTSALSRAANKTFPLVNEEAEAWERMVRKTEKACLLTMGMRERSGKGVWFRKPTPSTCLTPYQQGRFQNGATWPLLLANSMPQNGSGG